MSEKKIVHANEDSIEKMIEVEGLSEKDVKELIPIMNRFMHSYLNKEKSMTDIEWLEIQLKHELPEKSDAEIKKITDEIVDTILEFDSNFEDINKACDSGIEKEQWFANKVSDASTGISIVNFGNYLNEIDNAITNANAQMMRTVTTNVGNISQCINLDGFIAEQYAVNTFNMQAQLEGSKYVAEVMVPKPGETYGLNSFDTVIKDSTTGKIVHQYQFKYGKDAKATIKLLRDGNYNNQRFIVPADQVEEVRKAFPGKSVESYMGGTNTVSVKSKILTKQEAKNLQLKTQENGVLPTNNWNTYNTKELALNIGKNAGLVGVQSALITTGFDLVSKAVKGEVIDSDETIELALKTGADSGLKAVVSGTLKVGVEKEIINIIPKGTPAGVIANIACLGIENAKILSKVATNELSMSQALEQMGRTSTSMVYGLGWGATGMEIGAGLFSCIPVVGTVVGGIVGGMVGYMAGSEFGNEVYSGVKKVKNVATSTARSVWNGVKSVGSKIGNGIKSIGRRLFG